MEDTYELGLFVREYNKKHTKPLLAVGMGANGQLSRITSPISLVTHPLIPFPSAPGQLSLAQVHQARHLIGQLPAREFQVSKGGEKVAASLQLAFKELGYPYTCRVAETGSADVFDATNADLEAISSQFTKWTGRRAPSSVIATVLN